MKKFFIFVIIFANLFFLTACGTSAKVSSFDTLTQSEKLDMLVNFSKNLSPQKEKYFAEQPPNKNFQIIGDSGETFEERKKYSNLKFKPPKTERNFIGYCLESEGVSPHIRFQIETNFKLPLASAGYWAVVTEKGRLFGDSDNFKGREPGEKFWVGSAGNPISQNCGEFRPRVLVVMVQTVDYWYEQIYSLKTTKFSLANETWEEYSIEGDSHYIPIPIPKEPYFWKYFFGN